MRSKEAEHQAQQKQAGAVSRSREQEENGQRKTPGGGRLGAAGSARSQLAAHPLHAQPVVQQPLLHVFKGLTQPRLHALVGLEQLGAAEQGGEQGSIKTQQPRGTGKGAASCQAEREQQAAARGHAAGRSRKRGDKQEAASVGAAAQLGGGPGEPPKQRLLARPPAAVEMTASWSLGSSSSSGSPSGRTR